MLIFVDDILNISHGTKATLETLGTLYQLKPGSVGPPDRYLGGNFRKFQLEDRTMAWFMSKNDYVKAACANVVTMIEKDGLHLATGRQAETPYHENYRPEVDLTDEVNKQLTNRYQQLIGILRWAVELGQCL